MEEVHLVFLAQYYFILEEVVAFNLLSKSNLLEALFYLTFPLSYFKVRVIIID